jgi:hypothetical protein
MPPSDGTWTIKDQDGDVTLKAGEWYVNPKARPRRLMLNSLSSDARRVYACLELATMGFARQTAVTMENGRCRPLLLRDVARQTGLKPPNVDRGFDELETEGLAARRPIDATKPLHKGNIALYSWAVPRLPEEPRIVIARDNNNPSWLPPSWADPTSVIYKKLKRLKIILSPDFTPPADYIEQVENAAREYEEADDCLSALLRLSGARESLSGAPGSANAASLYEKNREENNNNNSDGHPKPEPAPEPKVVAVAPVLDALSRYGDTTEKGAERLIKDCRTLKPDCRDEEIVAAIHRVSATITRSTRNPIGMLLSEVPAAVKAAKPQPRVESDRERKEREFREVLEHPDEFDAETVEYARKAMAKEGV